PAILAARPAAIQVSYLGYPGTMGADFIDYVIADRIVLPFDQQEFYREKNRSSPGQLSGERFQTRDSGSHSRTPRTRLTRAGVCILLLQQQLENQCRDVRHLDAAPARRGRERAVALSVERSCLRQSAARGVSARHRA